ncbi:MAG TPA: nucleoside-diphosphate kinase [Thiotrichaceae bacterium]|jgi:nucleoside-diphosphate kinase|nr:nucleoside-diphosphate kinase [Thiotrichaceae bacterium]HIM08115.1 nucleoside-diphosphate kinase [Gammaproteobacteria bacterium]
MALERTLAIIKPDAVASDFTGNILALIEKSGLNIIAAKMLHLSVGKAEELYAEHQGRPFYNPLLNFMTSGPVMVQVLEGENAIKILRDLMGATIPKEAEVGTIRNLYANHDFNGEVHENAIHGSDSLESAQREIDFFFNESEICPRTR